MFESSCCALARMINAVGLLSQNVTKTAACWQLYMA